MRTRINQYFMQKTENLTDSDKQGLSAVLINFLTLCTLSTFTLSLHMYRAVTGHVNLGLIRLCSAYMNNECNVQHKN